VERIAHADAIEVDELATTTQEEKGFGPSDLSSKRSVMTQEEKIRICFLQAESNDNEILSTSDIGYHPQLSQEKKMLSTAPVNAALTQTMNNTFLYRIKVAGKEDQR